MTTGKERIEAALRGERPDRVPVMLHNFPMAAREAGYTQRQYREDPAKIAECFVRTVERYGVDGVVVDVDTATLAGALGVPVDFPEDEPARCHGRRLASLDGVADLELPDLGADRRVQVWLEATRLLKREIGDEIYVRGNCDQCPFSLAAAVRGLQDWLIELTDASRRPAIDALLARCTEVTSRFLELMAETGADMLSGGDSPAGPDLISPRMYRAFALPSEQRIVERAHALGKPWLLHVCGNTAAILDALLETGADALELDYKTDVRLVHERLAGRVTFSGNLDPSGVLALGTPRLVEEKTRELLELYADEPRFILNAGCAIPATTPPENLRAMLRAARG